MLKKAIPVALMLMVNTACTANSNEPAKPEFTALVKVYKSDESLQCMKGGVSLEKMSEEILEAGIPIFCQQKNKDGNMRPLACGGPAGKINVFQIPVEALEAAQDLGFKQVSELRRFSDQPCQ